MQDFIGSKPTEEKKNEKPKFVYQILFLKYRNKKQQNSAVTGSQSSGREARAQRPNANKTFGSKDNVIK